MSSQPVEHAAVEAAHGPLPGRLKAATSDLHRRAERSRLMHALLSGHLSRERYLALMHNLAALYAELEAQLRAWSGSPFVVLDRQAALDGDLSLLDPEPSSRPPLAAAMEEYVQRLRGLAVRAPHRLAAHAYVRYLGDLYGGQVLRGCVRRLFDLPDDRALRFYSFGDEATTTALRTDFRQRLGLWHVSAGQADEVVAEAQWAYEAHVRLFDELLSPN
ncbi:MAG: biliverdin-producing heme oxygenase [Rubrivivax sp.]|nr:biliverdin-producing heme oxygenase [Rubrivivax sp.]